MAGALRLEPLGLPRGCQGFAEGCQTPISERSEGCETPISQRSGWPERCVWNTFTIKTFLELAGLRMGAPSAGPCLSGAWVSHRNSASCEKLAYLWHTRSRAPIAAADPECDWIRRQPASLPAAGLRATNRRGLHRAVRSNRRVKAQATYPKRKRSPAVRRAAPAVRDIGCDARTNRRRRLGERVTCVWLPPDATTRGWASGSSHTRFVRGSEVAAQRDRLRQGEQPTIVISP